MTHSEPLDNHRVNEIKPSYSESLFSVFLQFYLQDV